MTSESTVSSGAVPRQGQGTAGQGLRVGRGLPSETSSFVGREDDLARVGTLLASARLVTVVGAGGVGKTRLALRAAARAASQFADGTCLVYLSALRSPDLVANTVAASLGLPEEEGRPPLEAITGYLRRRRVLLILDTCEHLVDACALFAESLLYGTDGVTILATSREPLSLPEERVYPLAPLPVPEPGAEPVPGDAVDLLARRARDVVPGFRVTGANRADAVRLAARLGGIPLAIELAVVRLRAFPLAELVHRAEGRLPLTGSRRDSAERHRTLRAAIGWSYDLCSPAERELWARLSVFAGRFEIDAAVHVCAYGDLSACTVTDGFMGLADKSVLAREPVPGAGYRILDTIREFGAEKLAADGGQATASSRHLDYCLRLARELDASPLAGQLDRYRTLAGAHPDLRAALEYGFSLPSPDTAAELATSLLWYWQVSGLREGQHWLGRAIERTAGQPEQHAAALLARGYLAAYQGEADAAADDIQAGISASESASGEQKARLLARAHAFHCRAMLSAGRFGEAVTAAAEAERLLDGLTGPGVPEADADRGLRVLLITQQAYLDFLTSHPGRCVTRSADGLALARPETGERWASSYLHGLRGLALFVSGRKDEGNAATLTGLKMRHELGDTVGIAYGLGVAAIIAAGQDRWRRAAWLLGAADPLWERAGAVFSGTPAMQALLGTAEDTARRALGGDTFGQLRAEGARIPLADALSTAIADADDLTPPEPKRNPAPLTPREREIAQLAVGGLTSREVADKLFLSKRTVDAHLAHIYAKAGISSRVQLVSWIYRQAL